MSTGDASFLDGQLLIAMPGMGDPRFDRSVIFMCAHSPEGAMGLIVNKPAPDLSFADLLSQLKIPATIDVKSIRVHFGGPVEHGRGFVLHSADYSVEESSLQVSPDFAMTATVDILQDMARGSGPKRALMALGYAGWGPGQLEGEYPGERLADRPGQPGARLQPAGWREVGGGAARARDRSAAAVRRGRTGLTGAPRRGGQARAAAFRETRSRMRSTLICGVAANRVRV